MLVSSVLCTGAFGGRDTQPYPRRMDYPAVLRSMMKVGRYKQADLAHRLKVQQPTVSRWLKGATPETPQHERIVAEAQRLGILKPTHILPDDPDTAEIPADGILELDYRGGLGGGGVASREVRRAGDHADPVKPEAWHFPAAFMREELRAPASRLVIIETQGDSMAPTIAPGERVVVDTGHKIPSPDGIYALRDRFGAVVVKRVQVPLRRGEPETIKIISDNKAHGDEDVGPDEIDIIGRVVCALRRF